MYVLHNKEAHNALRAIAMLVVVALMFWAVGVIPFSQKAEASNVTSFSDTLSDSDLQVVSNHTIRFTIPNGATSNQFFTLTFGGGFSLGSNTATGLDFNDMDVTVNGVETTLATTTSGASTWGVATTSSTITFTTGTAGIASSSAIVIEIGSNATSGATGDTFLVNPPTTSSPQIDLSGSVLDSGHTRVAIIDNVVVTATVNTSFSFTVNGLATSSLVNGTSTTRTSTATAIPFGTLTAGVGQTLAQQLHVTTNAAQGFAVTVMQDSNLLSSTGADIDGFVDGAYTNTPQTWVSPTPNISNEKTWGHWALTSEDDEGGSEFAGTKFVAASTTPRTIFTHSGPSDGSTANIGSTTVGYKVEITALQEAGDDYTTTLTYVATPTF